MRPATARTEVIRAAGLSTVGLVTHNLAEFPAGILLRPETLGPVAVTAFLLVVWLKRPRRSVLLLLSAWATVHLVLGGSSVFPLPFLPFEPEQTVGHYAAHAVYAAAQIPLLWLPSRRHASPPSAGSQVARSATPIPPVTR